MSGRAWQEWPVLILAGRGDQAAAFALEQMWDRSQWRYVHGPESAVGIRGGRFVIVGTFWDRGDAGTLRDLMDERECVELTAAMLARR